MNLVVFQFNRFLPEWGEEFCLAFKIIQDFHCSLYRKVSVTNFDKNVGPKQILLHLLKGIWEEKFTSQNEMNYDERCRELFVCIILLICEYFKFVYAYFYFQLRILHQYNLWKGNFFVVANITNKQTNMFYDPRSWLCEKWAVRHRRLLKPLDISFQFLIYLPFYW